MKSNQKPNPKQDRQNVSNNQNRPEIRDNLDSRKNEEQDQKGDDWTNNEKETRNNQQRKKDG